MQTNNIDPKSSIDSAKRPMHPAMAERIPGEVLKNNGQRSSEEKAAQSTYHPMKPKPSGTA